MNVLQLVTARGGSKSIPDKNIKMLGGKPLIAWSIEHALDSKLDSRIVVSTDSPLIVETARAFGAETPFLRPHQLATDTATQLEVILHALDWFENDGWMPDVVILLQPTSPLRLPEDIEKAYEQLMQTDSPAVISVCEAESHPYLTHKITDHGRLECFSSEWGNYTRRQDLPEAYRENGAVLVFQTETLLRERTLLPPGTQGYVMPISRSLDLDTQWDFYLADLILSDCKTVGQN